MDVLRADFADGFYGCTVTGRDKNTAVKPIFRTICQNDNKTGKYQSEIKRITSFAWSIYVKSMKSHINGQIIITDNDN